MREKSTGADSNRRKEVSSVADQNNRVVVSRQVIGSLYRQIRPADWRL
jgi:hypothetical protein